MQIPSTQLFHRAIEVREMKIDVETRTVSLVFATDTPVERYFGWEILNCTPESIRVARLEGGVPLLLEHNTEKQIGIQVSFSIENGECRAVVKFSRKPLAEEALQDCIDKILKHVSVGYFVHKYDPPVQTDLGPMCRVTEWEPVEISLVGMPADLNCGIRRLNLPQTPELELPNMKPEIKETTEQPLPQDPDAARRALFLQIGEQAGVLDFAREAILTDMTEPEFRQKALEHKRKKELAAQTTTTSPVVLTDRERKTYSLSRAILSHAEGSFYKENSFEREISEEINRRMKTQARGFFVPSRLQTRAGLDSLTSTTGTELKLTQPGEFIDILRNKMVTAGLGVQMLTGLHGGAIQFAKQNAAASASWVAENPGSNLSDSNLTLTTVTLTPKTLMATTSFSRQLLSFDGNYDTEMIVMNDLAAIHALAIDAAVLNGSGSSNQPQGVLTASGVTVVALGTNGAVPTYSHMVDMETAVANANGEISTLAYVTTPGIRGKLKKTEEFATTNGRPVWQGGEVNGYRAEATKQMPSTLTKGTSSGNCHGIIFGPWNQVVVGEWGAYDVVTDPYSLKKQAMIEVTTYQVVGIVIRYPEAFAVTKDALTS